MNQICFFRFISILMFLELINSQPFDYPTANLSTTWINSDSAPHSVDFIDGSKVRAILLRGSFGPRFACGFYCNGTCDTYLFAVFIVQTNSGSGITSPAIGFPQVVWSANRNNPVKLNATLQLTSGGELVLRDVDGTLAWSSNTLRRSVAGLNLTESGNLALFDVNKSIVWQSFDHPTDSLVPGQRLFSGKRLTASVSDANWTQGSYFLSVTNEGLVAYIDSNPPQDYTDFLVLGQKRSNEKSYVKFQNGSLDFFILSAEPSEPDRSISIPLASSAQYMRLRPNGHLYVYEWRNGWQIVADLLTGYLGECNYPMVCGKNSICSKGQCSCPKSSNDSADYFRQMDPRQPDLGCSPITPLTCNASASHSFVELVDVTYFTFNADMNNTDIDRCREACLRNCLCKAVLFRYGSNSSSGDCYLPPDIFSLMNNEKEQTHYNASVLIKVQIAPSAIAPSLDPPISTPVPGRKNSSRPAILGSSLGGSALLLTVIAVAVFIVRRKKKRDGEEEDDFDHVPGLPTRFSYEELRIATENFSKKLGGGGFGSVFEGVLQDGTKIAVKCLDGIGQVKRSFLAEVESIGSIHHVNLVRLIGFCADKSHRLLVYEHMSNGSLDRWIYNRNQDVILDWKCRRKIIQDVAKGLVYLHEECRQKIVHLDIKPQNILLDENYNAKLSDFGLSKLIDHDQGEVVTTMRGTPGYLAPEWLNAVITEKVDVYSFGVVVLEILCGRKNFELSEPEEYRHLLSLFKMKAEEGRLSDLIDERSEDMRSHETEVLEMMQVAAWCLQYDHAKRPSMSVVVKVLEGVMDVEKSLDYSSLNSQTSSHKASDNHYADATPLLPSVLSGPR